MIHKFFNVPLNNNDFKNELTNIKTITINNGYSGAILDKVITKKRKDTVKRLICSIPNSIASTAKYLKLNYVEGTIFKIANKVNKFGIKTHCLNKNNLGNDLINVKGNGEINTKSAVSRIDCNSCEAVCYGQSVRAKCGAKENAKSIPKRNRKTAFAMDNGSISFTKQRKVPCYIC